MMVCFSGAQGSKVFKDIDARCLIHEGSAAKVGCTIMNKNKNVMLFDDGNLNRKEFSYLISLRSGYLPVRRADDFYIEPYLPHRFSRQFGFCQDIPSALARAVSDRKVSYNHALRHWRLLLFQGSNSRVCAPYLSLDVHQLRTPKFYDWWNSVSISDLRHYIGKLCLSAESDSSKSKKRKSHHEVGGDHRIDGHTSQNEGTGESIMRRDSSTKVGGRKGNEDKNTSDAESESDVDFKHQRRRTGHEVVDLGDDKFDYANALDNVSIPSNIPDDVGQAGDLDDIDLETPINVDGSILKEAVRLPTIAVGRTTPGRGKEIRLDRNLVQTEDSASPTKSHLSVDGPSSFDVNAKTLATSLEARGVKATSLSGTAVPTVSVSALRVAPTSQGIFAKAIETLGSGYLTELKKTPFDKISKRHDEASEVYKGIIYLKGDPTPLKCKVDRYCWAVKTYVALKSSMDGRQCFDKVEEARIASVAKLEGTESIYDATLQNHRLLEEENTTLKGREEELIKELEKVRQRQNQVLIDISKNQTSLTALETAAHAERKHIEELEAVPVCGADEVLLLEEQEQSLLALQSTLDSSEWMVTD